jgi:hypothetical protein
MTTLADLFRSDRDRPQVNDVMQVARGALRLAVVAVVLGAAGVGIGLIGRHAGFHCLPGKATTIDVEVAGTSARADPLLAACTRSQVTRPLLIDAVALVPVYVIVLAVACLVLGRVGYRVSGFRTAAYSMAGLVVLAGLLDEIENVALWAGLHGTDTALHLGDTAAAIAAAAAWPKLILLALAFIYVVIAALGYAANPFLPSEPPAAIPAVAEAVSEPRVGISLSGGGVRAATYGLGALQALDEADLFHRSRYLTAVSGGSYMAGAWTIARSHPEPDDESWKEEPKPWAAGSAEVAHFRGRLNYLRNRDGGLMGAIATLILGLAVNVGSLFVLLWLVARPLGWLVGSPMIGATPDHFVFGRHVWFPPVAWVVVTAVMLLVWVLLERVRTLSFWVRQERLRRAVGVLVLASATLVALQSFILLAVPGAVRSVRNPTAAAHWVQTALGAGVVVVVVGVLKRPARRYLPRAGGLLVLLFGVAAGGQIASQATVSSFHREHVTYLLVLAGFSVFYFFADPDWWSVQPYYRGRLRYAYANRRAPGKRLLDFEQTPETPLAEYRDVRPELVVCAAMNVSGRDVPTRVGVPAYSFTFSPHEITFNEPAGIDGLGATYSSDTAWYGRVFQRWDTPRLAVMTAVGMSGAAVSPAMGKFNRGSTGALLALANLRLGMWMPNPRYLGEAPADDDPTNRRRPGFPRRRLNYLVKEVFGVHDLGDAYVYVTDGGHWENLGVVELLRRRCTEVFCFDSSGSMTDSFGTLADAITLAAQELGVTIELGYEPLRALSSGGRLNRYVDRDCAVGLIHYPDGGQGLLWYAKASLTSDAPERLRAYKEKQDIFPCHPTTDQFFDTEQFETYRELGTFTTGHLLRLRAQVIQLLTPDTTARTSGGAGPGDLYPDESTLLQSLDDAMKAKLLTGMLMANDDVVDLVERADDAGVSRLLEAP